MSSSSAPLARLAALAVTALALAPLQARAQAYLIEEKSQVAYEPIAPAEGTTLATSGDAELFQLTLPFNFRFFSRTYSTVWISVNGGVTFLGQDTQTGQLLGLPDTNITVPSTNKPQAVLAAVWDDWKANANAPGGGSRIAYAVRPVETLAEDGSTQTHQSLVIDWQNMQRYGYEGASAAAYSFQLILHEGTDQYEIRFGPQTGTMPAVLDATSGSENHLGTVGVSHRTCSPACSATDLFVGPSPTLMVSPNLDPELTISLAKTGVSGGGPVIDVQVQNLGLSEADGVTFDLYLSRDATFSADDQKLYTLPQAVDLAARPSEFRQSVAVPMPPSAKGAYYIIGVVDTLEPISEQNKANNISAIGQPFIAGIDLTVEAFGQAAADVGGNSTYNVRVTNLGVRDASNVNFKLSMSGYPLTSPRILYTSSDFSVGAESNELKNITVTMPADLMPNAYTLDVTVDPGNTVDEADETNNALVEKLSVEMRGADIEVREVQIGVDTGFQGHPIPVQFVLENKGTAFASNFLYSVYLSTNDVITLQDTRVFLSGQITLDPKEIRPITQLVQVPATMTPGTYFVGVVTDAAGKVKEVNKSNNVAAAPMTIVIAPPTPDIVAASVTTQPQAAAGATVRVSAVLANTGTLTAAFDYGVYLSDNELVSPSDPKIASGQLTLAPGDQQTVAFDAQVPPTLRAGQYRVALIADPAKTLTDADWENNTAVAPAPLTVIDPALTVVNTALPDGFVATNYDVLLGTRGGAGAVKWRIAGGTLPTGLTLEEGGRLAGIPTQSGTFAIVVEASSANLKAVRALTLVVREYASSIGIVDTRMPAARRGSLYSQHIGVSGGTGAYTFTTTGGTLPPGLTLAADGLVEGFPITAGTYSFTIAVQDAAGEKTTGDVALDVYSEGALQLITTRLREGEVSRPYTATMTIEGGLAPYTVEVTDGTLPTGMTLGLDVSGVAATLSGTPLQTGVFGFTVVVSDSRGERNVQQLVLQVTARRLSFITTELPSASAGTSYHALVEANARAPFTFSVAGGELPPGLSLDSSGLISGTVTTDAPPRLYAFAVRVADTQGGDALAAFAIDLPVPVKAPVKESGCSSTGGTAGGLLLAVWLLSRRRARFAAGLVAMVTAFVALPARADGAYYRVVREHATFQPFENDGTATVVLDTSGVWDQGSTTTRGKAVPIPFNFKFFGVSQSVAGITSKGMVSFGSVNLNWSRDELTPLPATGGPAQFLAPLWGYVNLSKFTPTTPSVVSWRLEGTAPNRVMAVEWKNIQHAGWTPRYKGADYAAYSFQARMYEGSNDITYHYGGDAVLLGKTPPLGFAIGIEGTDGTQGIDASDTRCSPGCTAANFPIDTVIRFQVVPDLSLDRVEAPESLFEGVESVIRTAIRNSGDSDASRASARFVLSKDRFIDASDIVLANSPATTIVANAIATVNTQVVVPSGTAAGLYYLLSRVDPDNEIIEIDEQNNGFDAIPVVVLQRAADFTPVRIIGPNAVDAGTPFNITRTIKNQGNAAGSGTWRLVLSANALPSPADLTLEEGTFTLAPGEILDAQPSVTVPAIVTPGPYYLGLLVRPAAGVPEIDALNNDWVFGPITVNGTGLAITRDALPTVAAGAPFSIQLTATGGAGSYQWSGGYPALPAGTNLSADGVLSGQLETTGEWPVQVRVTSNGATVSRNYTLRAGGLEAPLSIVTRRLLIAQLATDYTSWLLAQGGTPPYQWRMVEPSAPPSGIRVTADGKVSGQPAIDGQATMRVRVTDAKGQTAEGDVILPIAGPTSPLFANADFPAARLGQAYSATVRGAGGTAPYKFAVVDTQRVASSSLEQTQFFGGEMPPGLTLAESGEVTGTPTLAGVYVVTLRLVDARANDATAQFAIAVGSDSTLSVRTRALPDATVGTSFLAVLSAEGGVGALSWQLIFPNEGGALPAGLQFLDAGQIMGKPLVAGQVSFLAVARDSAGQIAMQPLSIRVSEAPAAPEKSGCSQAGPGGLIAALIVALLIAGRRRARLMMLGAFALALFASGCTTKKAPACPQGCNTPFTCDENDGLCKCGGSGGALCTAGETCDLPTRSCLAPTCDTSCPSPLVCGEGGECRCGSASGPICAAGEQCNAFGRCETHSRCEGVVCTAGMSCDPTSGSCLCGPGGTTCTDRESCVDARCVADLCLGVACSGGTSCDPADGLCKCGGAGGAVCVGGEACVAAEARCEHSSRCDGVECGLGSSCDPADGLCKCGGPGGPRCGDGQSCDPVARRCLGGDQCSGVTCSGGTSCDPEDGLCKCGGFGGVSCTGAEACVVKGPQARCEARCDVIAPNTCGAGRGCNWDSDAKLAYCVTVGTAKEGQSCGAESGKCAAGLSCVGETPTAAGNCRSFCQGTVGCSDGYLCFPFQVDSAIGTCLPYSVP